MNYSRIMDGHMAGEVNSGFVAGNSALVIKDGKELYFNAFGYADAEKNIPMQRNTIIRLFSMTKPITAVATMIAQERGLIDLLDPISKYLPEYADMMVLQPDGGLKKANRPITIMNLLTMTSGIPYGENWEGASECGIRMDKLFSPIVEGIRNGERLTTREIVRKIAENPIAFEPGERWMYGFSADILGAIIEVATGKRFGEFLKQEIFDRLQMVDTGFYVPEEKMDRFAMSYEENQSGKLVSADESHLGECYLEDVSYEAGGCGLVSTIDDYANFAKMLINKGTFNGQRIISPSSVKFLTSNHLNSSQLGAMDWDSTLGYGYGCLMRVLVNQTKAGSQASIGEFGWDGWTGNYVSMDPEKNLIILYFIQKRGAGTTPVVRKLRAATYGYID